MGGRGGSSSAEESGVNALPGVGSNAIARCQEQAASCNLDMAIGTDLGFKLRDPPGCARRNTSHHVEVDCPIRSDAGDRNNADTALEFQLVAIVLSRGNAGNCQCYECYL